MVTIVEKSVAGLEKSNAKLEKDLEKLEIKMDKEFEKFATKEQIDSLRIETREQIKALSSDFSAQFSTFGAKMLKWILGSVFSGIFSVLAMIAKFLFF